MDNALRLTSVTDRWRCGEREIPRKDRFLLSSLIVRKGLEPSSGKGCPSLLYGAAAWESSRGPKEAKSACPALYQGSGPEGGVEARRAALQCLCGTRWVLGKPSAPVFLFSLPKEPLNHRACVGSFQFYLKLQFLELSFTRRWSFLCIRKSYLVTLDGFIQSLTAYFLPDSLSNSLLTLDKPFYYFGFLRRLGLSDFSGSIVHDSALTYGLAWALTSSEVHGSFTALPVGSFQSYPQWGLCTPRGPHRL